jgi:hypothetical protein
LWDLREKVNSSGGAGKNKKKIDGVMDISDTRKPCYSSVLTLNKGDGYASGSAYTSTPPRIAGNKGNKSSPKSVFEFFDGAGGGQHTSAIAQVEPLGDVNWSAQISAVSQFASVDADGVVILWVTTNITSSSGADAAVQSTEKGKDEGDLAKSPSAAVSLVQLKVLRLNSPFTTSMSLGLSLVSEHTVFSIVPNDVSTFLMSHAEGKVVKIVRFGEPSTPHTYYRPHSSNVEIQIAGAGSAVLKRDIIESAIDDEGNIDDSAAKKAMLLSSERKLHFPASVTCISTRSSAGLIDAESGSNNNNNSNSSSKNRRGEGKDGGDDEKNDDDAEDGKHADRDRDSSSSGKGTSGGRGDRRSTVDAQSRGLLLVGRSDGTVDLFRMDVCEPLQTWSLNDYADRAVSAGTAGGPRSPGRDRDRRGRDGGDMAFHNSPVAMVKWLPNRASAFVAADSEGRCYYFDLLENAHEPIYVESISAVRSLSNLSLDISQCRPSGNVVYFASAFSSVGESDGGNNLKLGITVRSLREGVLKRHVASELAGGAYNRAIIAEEEEQNLMNAMSRWVAHTHVPQVGALLKSSSVDARGSGTRK